MAQTEIETVDGPILITWIDVPDRLGMDQYQPCTQVYGVCFNEQGEILVIDEKGNGTWKPIGGTPEAGETPEQTLARELLEEADVELAEMLPIGVQRIEEFYGGRDQPTSVYYQWRFAGKIAKLHPQTPDPATGKTYQRKFVPVSEINEVVPWGSTGRAMFKAAVEKLDGRV